MLIKQLLPIISTYQKNKKIKKDMENIDIPSNIDTIEYKYLEEGYKNSVEAKNRFEDKAKSILAALTIAITLILNLSKTVDLVLDKISNQYGKYIIFIIAISSIIYMMIAGLMSIQVLIKENILYSIPVDKRTDKKIIFKSTKMNGQQNLIRNNIIFASYELIRNSLIALLVIFILSIWPSFSPNFLKKEIIETDVQSINCVYTESALKWILNNPDKNIALDEILEIYKTRCNNSGIQNIYDQDQDIVVTVEYQDGAYCIWGILNNIKCTE